MSTATQWTSVLPISDASEWQLTAFSQLRRIKSLPPNWDGYGSPEVSELAYRRVSALIFNLEFDNLPIPHLGPESGGAIQMDWTSRNRGLELHILPDGTISVLQIENDECVSECELPAREVDQCRTLLGWMIEG